MSAGVEAGVGRAGACPSADCATPANTQRTSTELKSASRALDTNVIPFGRSKKYNSSIFWTRLTCRDSFNSMSRIRRIRNSVLFPGLNQNQASQGDRLGYFFRPYTF